MTRVGFLGTGPAPTPATPYVPLREFRQGLDELGYVDGRDVVIETRWAEGRIDQLPALAAELVGLKVDIIVGVGAVVARAAKSATTTIPVVIRVGGRGHGSWVEGRGQVLQYDKWPDTSPPWRDLFVWSLLGQFII